MMSEEKETLEQVEEEIEKTGEPVFKKPKTLGNTNVNGARKNVEDLVVFGNGDMFKLLSKASSKSEGWLKSTKAHEIPNVGCIVQVTTQQHNNVAEAAVFVPGVKIKEINAGTPDVRRELVSALS